MSDLTDDMLDTLVNVWFDRERPVAAGDDDATYYRGVMREVITTLDVIRAMKAPAPEPVSPQDFALTMADWADALATISARAAGYRKQLIAQEWPQDVVDTFSARVLGQWQEQFTPGVRR